MERQVQSKNRGCSIGMHVPRQRLGYLGSRRCTVALDAGTHLDVGWAGVKGDMGVGGEGKKRRGLRDYEREIRDWYQGLVWVPSLGYLNFRGMAIAEIALIREKEHVVL